MPDAFETLRAPIVPIEPDPDFTARLRTRLAVALTLPEGVDVTVTTLDDLHETDQAPVPAPASARMVLTPYLAVADARRALDWYAEAFGARLRGEPIEMPDGRIGHAELELGGALIMLADEFPDIGHTAPLVDGAGGSSVTLHLEMANIDAVLDRAIDAGATLDRPPEDNASYGRNAVVVDPFGHRWLLSGAARPSPTPPPLDPSAFPSRYLGGTDQGDVGYVTLEVPDLSQAEAFYGAVLGWAFEPAREPNASRAVGPVPRTRLRGGSSEGGMEIGWRAHDLRAAVERVRALGGTAGEPFATALGLSATCTDDQGMAFHLWQQVDEDPGTFSVISERLVNGRWEGDLAYLTINVVDSGRFRAFFGELFEWEFRPGRVEDGWQVEDPLPMTGLAGGASRASAVPMYRVDDIEAAVERVRAAGGSATPPEQMPYGRTSDCADDQGIPFYLGQM